MIGSEKVNRRGKSGEGGGLTASVSRGGQPGKLHLGGGLGLGSLGLLRGLNGAFVLSERGGGDAEDQAEAESDGHDLFHSVFLLRFRRRIRLCES